MELVTECLDVAILEKIKSSVSAGYSIFVIRGNLPECEAEQILGFMRVQQQQRPRLIGEEEAQTSTGYVQLVKKKNMDHQNYIEGGIILVFLFQSAKYKLLTCS